MAWNGQASLHWRFTCIPSSNNSRYDFWYYFSQTAPGMIIDYLVLKQLQMWLLMLILYWWIIDNHSIKIPRSVLKQLQVSKLFRKITSRHGRLYQIQTNRYFLSDTIVAFRKQALQIKYCYFQLPFSEYWVAVALGGYRSALVLSLSFIMWASFYHFHMSYILSFIIWALSFYIYYNYYHTLSYNMWALYFMQ